jgi:phosphatidate cytidylyltransferase
MLLCFTVYHLSLGQTASVSYILPVYILLMLVSIIGELWDKSGNPLANWGNLFIGQVMIALPFALMNTLNVQSHLLLLAVFVLIWVNDTGAYCVGSLTAKRPQGNHKMFPRVSPKKSWEGLFGGIALAVGTGALLARFGWFDGVSECICPYITGIIFALVVSVFGTLGDLVESLIKRTVGVKDSGTFLPGHGGVLDRFDSVLLAAPASLLFLQILALFE